MHPFKEDITSRLLVDPTMLSAASPVTPATMLTGSPVINPMVYSPYHVTYVPLNTMNAMNTVNTMPYMVMPDPLQLAQLKVNWASSGNTAPKQDTSKHHHVFVGDLCPDVEQHNLRAAFSMYGEISDVKIIKDSTTNKPKGYGFVTFVNREDAKLAIDEMQGALLGGRNIRTNWATRKPVPNNPREAPKQLKYDEVYRMSSATNCTVYCGQSLPNLTEDLVKNYFSEYGNILEIRIFKDKGYAFVRFSEKDDATRAIVGVNGQEINGLPCRCSWGKESNESGNSQQQLPQPQGSASSSYSQYGYQQYQQPYNYQQYPGYVPQAGAYQQYYGNYQMPGYGGLPMGDQGGGAQGPHYNGQQMQNMGYQ